VPDLIDSPRFVDESLDDLLVRAQRSLEDLDRSLLVGSPGAWRRTPCHAALCDPRGDLVLADALHHPEILRWRHAGAGSGPRNGRCLGSLTSATYEAYNGSPHRTWAACSYDLDVARSILATPPVYAQAISLQVDAKQPLVSASKGGAGHDLRAESKETEDRPLRVAVNVGSFSSIEKVSPGVYRATSVYPETRFPRSRSFAVLARDRTRCADRFLAIPLSGRTKLRSRARAVRRSGWSRSGETFDRDRGRKGQAELMIAVPPGVIEVVGLHRRTRAEPRDSCSRCPAITTGHARGDALTWSRPDGCVCGHRARVLRRRKDPPPIDRIKLSVEKGEARPLGQTENRYRFRFVPHPRDGSPQVELRASVTSDKLRGGARSRWDCRPSGSFRAAERPARRRRAHRGDARQCSYWIAWVWASRADPDREHRGRARGSAANMQSASRPAASPKAESSRSTSLPQRPRSEDAGRIEHRDPRGAAAVPVRADLGPILAADRRWRDVFLGAHRSIRRRRIPPVPRQQLVLRADQAEVSSVEPAEGGSYLARINSESRA